LKRHRWPGNVRELENAIERATVLCETTHIDVIDLPEEVRFATPAPTTRGGIRPLEDVEREYILAALEANGGTQARTAAQLGIGTATLYRRLKQYEREAGA
jgi:DNA-binding NtrC family response regulator